MPQTEIINPLDRPDWDDLLISCPGHTFFHSSAWARVLREVYHYTPAYFTVFEDEKLLALVPVMEVNSFLTGKRGVSLPFTDYCDAMIHNGISSKNLFQHITEYGEAQGWKSFELRDGKILPRHVPSSRIYFRHILNLSKKAEDVFSSFSKSTRRNIREAINKGVKVEVLHTLDSIRNFHRLNQITRKRHGLPPQPFCFFKEVYEHIISKSLGFVVLASYENTIIAGAVYFHFGKRGFWKYGASDKRFHRLRPNNLVMWEAIKWFSENGYESICFGRTEWGNLGLRRFKAGWGTREYTDNYYRYDFNKGEFIKESSEIREIYRHVFRRLPTPLLSAIGSLLYRHVG